MVRHGNDLEKIAERYALVTEVISEGVYDWDIENNALYVSGPMTVISGILPSQASVDDWNRLVHPDDFPGYRDTVIRHFKGEIDRVQCEYRVRRTSGDFIWVMDTARCLRDDAGRAVRLIGAIQDITGRKLAEQHIREARKQAEQLSTQLSDAIEAISEGIVLFDGEDRVTLHNSKFREYFAANAGPEVAALIEPGAPFWDILREAHARGMFPTIGKDVSFEAYVEMRKAARRDPGRPLETLLADGRWIQIDEHRTASGGIASVYADITEFKRREVELSDKTEMLESLSSRLSKYLSPQIFSSIFENRESVRMEPKRKKLTVFFSDIVGFTALVDLLESEELTALLNQYLTEMSAIAISHGATVDKFIGDAMMAFFGDPVSNGAQQDAQASVRMALAMQKRLAELREHWRNRGIDDTFELRIGIATGFCTVGNFGSEDRLDYTAIGTTVNLASRLQNLAEAGGILLDNETYHLAQDVVGPAENLSVSVKGLGRSVRAFKVDPSLGADDHAYQASRPGCQVWLNPDQLDDSARAEARRILRQALERLA